MLITQAAIQEMLVRITNREDRDQTASEEAVWSGTALYLYYYKAFLADI